MDNVVSSLIRTKPFDRLTEAQVAALASRGTIHEVEEYDVLLSPDQTLDSYLVLIEGSLGAKRDWRQDDNRLKTSTWTISAMESQPGGAVISPAGQGLSLWAISPSRYLTIDADDVDELLGLQEHFADDSAAGAELSRLLGLIRELNVFRHLPMENVREAFDRMQKLGKKAGEEVVKEGEKGDAYYLLVEGDAEVWRTDPFTDETSCVAVLGPGDGFGEEALLQDAMRNATVRMKNDGKLLVLRKADFDGLVKHTMVEEISAEEAQKRIESGKWGLIDCRYDLEYEESRIPGSTLLPLHLIRDGANQLDPDRPYVVYCRSGRRSKAATYLLRERNIKAVSMIGGIRDWPYEVNAQPIG